MIVSINESTKEIKLVSVYRDTLMEIASGSMDTTQKVNYLQDPDVHSMTASSHQLKSTD